MKLHLFDPTNYKYTQALHSLLAGEELERFVLRPPRPDMPCFIYLIKSNEGMLYGSVDIFDVDVRLGSAQIGVWTKNAPVGIGVWAVRRVLKAVFEHLPIHRIEACIRDSNSAVGDLLRRFGFTQEGVLRMAAGDEHVVIFGMLKHEFYAKWERSYK